MALGLAAGQYAVVAVLDAPGSLPFGSAAAWLSAWPFTAGFLPLPFLFLLFPTGRLPGPGWRPLAWAGAVVYAANVFGVAFQPGTDQPRGAGPAGEPAGHPGPWRSLVYGLLSALLGALCLIAVLLLGRLLVPVTGDDALAVAGSTLAVAALFQPARRRVQNLVDRRFNQRRYDAARTVAAFSTRLRDQLELDALSGELLAVVDGAVRVLGLCRPDLTGHIEAR